MDPEKPTKEEKFIVWIILAIFTISVTCVAYVISVIWIHVAKNSLQLDSMSTFIMIAVFAVIIHAISLLYKVYKVENLKLSWCNLNEPAIFETISALSGFPLLPGLIIALCCNGNPFVKLIGPAMIEFSILARVVLSGYSFFRRKRKTDFVSLELYALLAIGLLWLL
jgi:hypothetical protein